MAAEEQVESGNYHQHPHIYQDPAGTVCFQRSELVRIVAKFLDDMGYSQTASQLESESGIKCQSNTVSLSLHHLVQGQWAEALQLLSLVKLKEDITHVQRIVLERKFAEYLEGSDILEAIECLRLDVAPLLHMDIKQAQLERLARCLLSPSPSDASSSSLASALTQAGQHLTSRLELAKMVKRVIAPSELVPSGMLENFIADALRMSQSVMEEKRSSPSSSTGEERFISDCNMHLQKRENLKVLSLFGEGDNEINDMKATNSAKHLLPTKVRRVLEGHSDEVWDMVISTCGNFLASASLDRTVKIWSINPRYQGSYGQVLLTLLSSPQDIEPSALATKDSYETFKPFGLSWSGNSQYLLCCSQESTHIYRWDVSAGLKAQSTECYPVQIYSHHTGREVTVCSWIFDHSVFISGGSDSYVCLCNVDGTKIACQYGARLSDTDYDVEGRQRKSPKPVSSPQLTDSEAWTGNEVRDILVLQLPFLNSDMNGLRFVSAFSDNSFILCEVVVNELYDGSSKSYLYNIVRLSRILAPGPIVSFGNICRLRRNRSKTDQKDSNVVTVFPVLLNEGVIGFLETKGRMLNFLLKPDYNVAQYRFFLKPSIAYCNESSDSGPQSLLFACGGENCKIMVCSSSVDLYFENFSTPSTSTSNEDRKIDRNELKGHIGPINAVIWSPHDFSLISASDDGSLIIWEP